MQSYRLLKPYGTNNAGEVAGFADEDAKRLIALGVLEAEDTPATIPATEETKPIRPRGRKPKPKPSEN